MMARSSSHRMLGGSTLVEVLVSVGVLAVAVPLVFGALAESGDSSLAARAETRSAWITPVCMDEIRASREGRSRYFPATVAGQMFPPDGDVWALAFSADGEPVGKLSTAQYQQGLHELNRTAVRYIAIMKSVNVTAPTGTDPMLRVDISLEYPAARRATERRKLVFHTRMP